MKKKEQKMSRKVHISRSGKLVECHARERSCPREHVAPGSLLYEQFMAQQKRQKRQETALPRRVLEAETQFGGNFVTDYTLPLDAGVTETVKVLREVGTPLIVGGAVRDSFIGAENKDIDIEVHHTDIDSLITTLTVNGYRVDEVGKQFGVLKVSKPGVVEDLDVSVPRRENRTGAGHRGFEIETSPDMTVSEAAERRDFTFNSVMYDPERRMLVDPYHGKTDFEHKVMRHVSDKFGEDPLRVLRGFQFAGRFGMVFADETATECRRLRPEYDTLSVERIQTEWEKFYTKATQPAAGIQALQTAGWDDTIPGLRAALNNPHIATQLNNLQNIPKGDRVTVGAAIIGHVMDETDRNAFIQTTIIGKAGQQKAYALATVQHEDMNSPYRRKVLARRLEKQGFTFAQYETYATCRGDDEGAGFAQKARTEGVFNGAEPDYVQGADIIAATDRQRGRWITTLLDTLRDRQFRGEFRNREEALTAMKDALPLVP